MATTEPSSTDTQKRYGHLIFSGTDTWFFLVAQVTPGAQPRSAFTVWESRPNLIRSTIGDRSVTTLLSHRRVG